MGSCTIVSKASLIRILIATLATLASVMICLNALGSPVPKLVPHVSDMELAEQIKQATLIVIGVAEDERAVRTVVSEPKEELMPLQLRAVRIRVEGVLEGRFDGEQLTFYYYQTTGAWDGPPINILSPEERGIFYLVNDGGVLRATTDVYLSHTRVVTGKHHVSPVSRSEHVPTAIAWILLKPGEGAKLENNLDSWRRSVAVALSVTPQMQVIQILHDDLESPNKEARGRACLLLADFPLNQKSCLPSIVNDAQVLPEDRKRARELIRQK